MSFYDFHIHGASGKESGISRTRVHTSSAKTTDRYGEYRNALICLIKDANVDVPPDRQGDFFEEYFDKWSMDTIESDFHEMVSEQFRLAAEGEERRIGMC